MIIQKAIFAGFLFCLLINAAKAKEESDGKTAMELFASLPHLSPVLLPDARPLQDRPLSEQFYMLRHAVAKLDSVEQFKLFMLLFLTRPDLDGESAHLFLGMFSLCPHLPIYLESLSDDQLRRGASFNDEGIKRFRRAQVILRDWVEKAKFEPEK